MRSIIADIHGRDMMEAIVKAAMTMPISALVPPCPVINSGKRKKELTLDIVNRFARAIVRNARL